MQVVAEDRQHLREVEIKRTLLWHKSKVRRFARIWSWKTNECS